MQEDKVCVLLRQAFHSSMQVASEACLHFAMTIALVNSFAYIVILLRFQSFQTDSGYSILFCSRLCPSTTGSSSPSKPCNFLLCFAVLVHTVRCCPTMSSLQLRFGLPTVLYLPLCASNGPSTICYQSFGR